MPIDDCNLNCQIRRLYSPKANKPKMVVPIFKSGGQWYAFLINSSPSQFLAHRPALADLEILLERHLHPGCLDHDSYLSIHSNNIENFTERDLEGADVLCVLNPAVRNQMADAIAGSTELRAKTQRLMVVALQRMGLRLPDSPPPTSVAV